MKVDKSQFFETWLNTDAAEIILPGDWNQSKFVETWNFGKKGSQWIYQDKYGKWKILDNEMNQVFP